jgi:hypothetical protein
VVLGVVARDSALDAVAKDRTDAGVDVDVQAREQAAPEGSEGLLSQQVSELLASWLVEALHVGVEGVEAAETTAGEVDEEGVGGEGLEVEEARGAADKQVEEKTDLGVHGVDDAVALLQGSAEAAQVVGEARGLDQGVEGNETTEAGQGGVVGTEDNAARVGAHNGVAVLKPLSTTAAKEVPTNDGRGGGRAVVGALAEGGEVGGRAGRRGVVRGRKREHRGGAQGFAEGVHVGGNTLRPLSENSRGKEKLAKSQRRSKFTPSPEIHVG